MHLRWRHGGSHVVIDGVLALIDSGGLRPGQPLPSERELARRFEVGRRRVRAAMATLIDGGIVEIGPDGDLVVASTAADPSLAALVRTRRLVSARVFPALPARVRAASWVGEPCRRLRPLRPPARRLRRAALP